MRHFRKIRSLNATMLLCQCDSGVACDDVTMMIVDAFWLFAHLGVGGLCLVCAELERPTPSSSLRSSFLFDSNSHQTHYQNYL